jgi:hypothetical protein
METGFRNLLILIFSLVGTYLMPITISFATYLALICVKERSFKNEVCVKQDLQSQNVEEASMQMKPESELEIAEPNAEAEPQSNIASELEVRLDDAVLTYSSDKSSSSCSIEINRNRNSQDSNLFSSESAENRSEDLQLETNANVVHGETIENSSHTCKSDLEPFNDKEGEELAATLNEERRQAEIRAAKRSIETNLIAGLVFFLVYGIFIVMSSEIRQSFGIIAFSMLKGHLPIFTTVANFGTVHSVMLQYWKYLKFDSK